MAYSSLKLTREEWDSRFVRLAFHVAMWSKDPSTKVGAVLVGKNKKREVCIGYNGLPEGIKDTDERLQNRDLKKQLIIHAERNVLDNVLFETEGSTLYATLFPCHVCAGSIIGKRIKRIVAPVLDPRTGVFDRYKESFIMARDLFEEAGIKVMFWTPPKLESGY